MKQQSGTSPICISCGSAVMYFIIPRLASAFFHKFCPAFRTADTDFSFSFGDSDFLSALRTGIDMEILSLLLYILGSAKKAFYLILQAQIFLILCIPLLNISGKHPIINQNN